VKINIHPDNIGVAEESQNIDVILDSLPFIIISRRWQLHHFGAELQLEIL
jgi:hypothetical protein